MQRPLFGDGLEALVDARRAADVARAKERLQRLAPGTLRMLKRWPPLEEVGEDGVRFAAIRYSGGTLLGLREAIALARTDWRDLLVGAGFAHDVEAHTAWRPARLDRGALERWLKGDLPGSAHFGLGQVVVMALGPHQGRTGAIISLEGLEPEPKYSVEWETGKHTTTWQHLLTKTE